MPLSLCSEPSGHDTQDDTLEAPTELENLPTGQEEQLLMVAAALATLYFPATQSKQLESFFKPTLSLHRPSGHAWHTTVFGEPSAARPLTCSLSVYRPATQSTHPFDSLSAFSTTPYFPRPHPTQRSRFTVTSSGRPPCHPAGQE